MALPEPKYALNGHCSIIYNETLYVYSPTGFQSLKLKEGAEWEALPMDISLTGAQCVKAVPKGNAKAAKLYIVGGAVNETASTWEYPGLMHYSFATKKWDWQRSEVWTTMNRQNHGAVYLEDSRKILVYAGSQTTGDTIPSTQTFLFSTEEPFSVQSMQSSGAPPATDPMLLASDASSAVMVGGGGTNTAIWKFSEDKGWTDMGVALEKPIISQEHVQCSIINGPNGMQVLEKFDMSVSPNIVERIVLVGKDGKAPPTGTTLGDKTKRFTVSDWPEYNSTLAPTSQRSGYSLAQGDDGMTVASGGNQTEPLVIFNAKENSWMNATAMFSGDQQVRIQATPSSSILSATPTASTSASATAPVVPAAAPDNKSRMLTVLGATLGTIFGIAAILILVLLFLRYRRNKQKAQQTGYANEKDKDRMSFADRGADFMKEAGGSVMTNSYTMKNDSTTSLAIIQGRGANNHKKNMASDTSTAGLVKGSSPLAYTQPVELSKFDLKPESNLVRQNSSRAPPVNTRARSSGWSKYFANNEATNLANIPAADRSTYASDRSSTMSQSQYTNSQMYSQYHSSLPPPLEIPKFPTDSQRLSRVPSGSPTLGSSIVTLPHHVQPMSAELSRANSNGSVRSGLSHNGEHHGRQPVESWSPVDPGRPASSTYTGSMHLEPGQYPSNTDSFYPRSAVSSFYPGQSEIPDTRDSTFTMFGQPAAGCGVLPNSGFSAMYPTPPRIGDQPQDRGSTVTVFPGPNAPSSVFTGLPSPTFYAPPHMRTESSNTMFPGPDLQKKEGDMSWLNLGAQK